MIRNTFRGFPSRAEAVPVPALFFTQLLKKIDDINELKLTLYIFWHTKFRRGYYRFVTFGELLNSASMFLSTGKNKSNTDLAKVLQNALDLAVEHGTLIRAGLTRSGESTDVVFLNTEQDRIYLNKLVSGEIKLPLKENITFHEKDFEPLKNIYELYEQNIGVISPIIAEELKMAEDEYPLEWLTQAFKEAAELNKRSWRYIARILARWSAEGKDDGKTRGYIKKEENTTKYVRGKYGHMVRR